jgi:predicted CopG family antitoxin
MDTSIRISEQTKAELERLKRDDESFDQLLHRLAADWEPIETGTWDSETADRARESITRSREDFGDWQETAVDPRTVDNDDNGS